MSHSYNLMHQTLSCVEEQQFVTLTRQLVAFCI